MRSGLQEWWRRCGTATRPGFGRDPNPLRRRSDRLQAVSGLAAVLLVLTVLPIAVTVSVLTWRDLSGVADRESASRHQVAATVTAENPDAQLGRSRLATLTWTYPDRVRHQGHLAVAASTAAGDRVPVWVNDSGYLTLPPTSRFSVWLDSLGLGLALIGAAGLLALGWYRLARRWLNRQRTRELDDEWRRFNESRSEGFRDTRG